MPLSEETPSGLDRFPLSVKAEDFKCMSSKDKDASELDEPMKVIEVGVIQERLTEMEKRLELKDEKDMAIEVGNIRIDF